jgi:23S rRNA (cytosine1962-C5)-methyltransferase
MFASEQYELVDFGGGRKLERFGPYLVDRPSPAAQRSERRRPERWAEACARYEGVAKSGRWSCARPIDQPWQIHFGPLAFELKLTDSGQLGVFPEQAENWHWISQQARRAEKAKVLNLFAYTGGATLAAAAAGAEVVHVDAAAGSVAWARRNAAASGLDHLPIRWIVEDVVRFVRREGKRGNFYDAVILDPPAYGHGPGGERWQLADELDGLLAASLDLCRGRPRFLLVTCHSGRLARAGELLNYATSREPRLAACGAASASDLFLISSSGEKLHCGAAARWSRMGA